MAGLARRGARRILAHYANSKWTWRMRARSRRADDALRDASAWLRQARGDAKESWRIGRAIGRPIAISIVLAAGLLWATALLNRHVGIHWKIGASTYDILFQTIGSVTGVFLALYFTAVSTVAATAYANVPTETRDLLVREKLGNNYVRLVAFLAAYSVGVLGLHATGHGPWELAVVVGVISAATAIFAFVQLGRRAFQFFDPVAMASLAVSDLTGAVRRAIGIPRPPTEPAAQRARADARRAADALDSLIALTVEQRRLRGAGLVGLVRNVLFAVSDYSLAKTAIPSRSQWFGTRYAHRQWYLSESTVLAIASQSLQPLQPEEIPDLDWLEDALLHPVKEVIERAAKNYDFETLRLVLPQFVDVASAAGATFCVRSAIAWLDPVIQVIKHAVLTSAEPGTEHERVKRLAVIGVLTNIPCELEVALYRRVHDLTAAKLDSEVRSVDVAASGAAYRLAHRLALPRRCIESLEMVVRGREFEELASVGTTTPAWYVRDLTANSLLWAIHEEWQSAHEYVRRLHSSLSEEFAEAGRHLEAATVRSSALAASWRLLRHCPTIDERDHELRDILVLSDLQHPSWDNASTEEAFELFRLDLLREMAASVPHLALLPQTGRETPDYLGEAVHRTGVACFEALERNDTEYFQAIFEPYFSGILTIVDRVRPQVAEWWPQTAGPWIAAPIIDLLTISGYARVYSEFHGNDALWDAVRTLWDRWLKENDQRLRVIDAMVSIERDAFALQPRAILRTQWEMRLRAALEALPRREPTSPWREGRIDHVSPLIRALSPIGGLFVSYSALDVFTALYLQERPGADDFDFGVRGSRDDHLRHLRERIANPKEEEGEE